VRDVGGAGTNNATLAGLLRPLAVHDAKDMNELKWLFALVRQWMSQAWQAETNHWLPDQNKEGAELVGLATEDIFKSQQPVSNSCRFKSPELQQPSSAGHD